MQEYEYNGLHWRTVKRHDTSTPADGLDQQTRLYYDASWRVVEERVDENYISSSGINRHMQNLWGARYIDDLVARRRDANMDGDCLDAGDATFYAVTDVQFSVVAMLTSTGKLHERVAYDSYGTARHHWMDDVDGDGDVDSTDKTTVTAMVGKSIYQSGFNPNADLDRSGTIDSSDVAMISTSTIAALAAGEISDRSATGPDNVLGYDGYVFNAENLLYTVRFRHYDTGLGRWLERDPAGYVDGMNSHQYCANSPLASQDPLGLWPPVWAIRLAKLGRLTGLGTIAVVYANLAKEIQHVNYKTRKPAWGDVQLITDLLEWAHSCGGDVAVDAARLLRLLDEGNTIYVSDESSNGIKAKTRHFFLQPADIFIYNNTLTLAHDERSSNLDINNLNNGQIDYSHEMMLLSTLLHEAVHQRAWALTDNEADAYDREIALLRKLLKAAKEGTCNPCIRGRAIDFQKLIPSLEYVLEEAIADRAVVVPPRPTPSPIRISPNWGLRPACFATGTLVATPTGFCCIEDLRVGDLVLGRTMDGSPVVECTVRAISRRSVSRVHIIRIGQETITTTSEHPFFVRERGWVPVRSLHRGELVVGIDGLEHPIESIVDTNVIADVWNLSVSVGKTFFVGRHGYYVHNKPP